MHDDARCVLVKGAGTIVSCRAYTDQSNLLRLCWNHCQWHALQLFEAPCFWFCFLHRCFSIMTFALIFHILSFNLPLAGIRELRMHWKVVCLTAGPICAKRVARFGPCDTVCIWHGFNMREWYTSHIMEHQHLHSPWPPLWQGQTFTTSFQKDNDSHYYYCGSENMLQITGGSGSQRRWPTCHSCIDGDVCYSSDAFAEGYRQGISFQAGPPAIKEELPSDFQ